MSIDLAALAQQLEVFGAVARKPDLRARFDKPSPWLRGRWAVVTRPDGSLRTCRHVRPGESLWLLLWSPQQVVCHRCSVALHQAIQGQTEDSRCDVCGHLGDAGVFPFVVCGPQAVTIVGGCCADCRPIVTSGWGAAA